MTSHPRHVTSNRRSSQWRCRPSQWHAGLNDNLLRFPENLTDRQYVFNQDKTQTQKAHIAKHRINSQQITIFDSPYCRLDLRLKSWSYGTLWLGQFTRIICNCLLNMNLRLKSGILGIKSSQKFWKISLFNSRNFNYLNWLKRNGSFTRIWILFNSVKFTHFAAFFFTFEII